MTRYWRWFNCPPLPSRPINGEEVLQILLWTWNIPAMYDSFFSFISASTPYYRKMEIHQAQYPADSELGSARVPSAFSVHTIQLDRPSSNWSVWFWLWCVYLLPWITHSLLLLQCTLPTLDTASNGFQYIILLPGGLQMLSGIIDIQRGSYFGAITFIGLVLGPNDDPSYGAIVISNGVTLLLDNLLGQVRRNYQQFLAVSNIAFPFLFLLLL